MAVIAQVAVEPARTTPLDTQLQRERAIEDANERARLQAAPNVSLEPGANTDLKTTALPAEAPCFKIDRVSVSVPQALPEAMRALGASQLPQDGFRFLQDMLDQYAGRCIGPKGLNLIVHRASGLLLERGYTTTRVAVPEQDLSSGMLKIALFPGVIRRIRFADESMWGTWRSAFPTGAGQLLNLRDLEQGLEQMKRVTSQDVDMQIVPGDLPGESDVVITVTRTRLWKVIASVDDSGSKSSGKLQGNLSAALDNPLGLNDLLNVGVVHDLNVNERDRGTKGANAYYSIPLGYWTLSVAAGAYDYFQQIAGVNQSFVSSGNSKNLEVRAQYLFQRDRVQKNSLQFRLVRRWNHAYIDDTSIGVQQRATTFGEIGWLHKHYFGAAQLDLNAAWRFGVPWMGGQSELNRFDPTAPAERDKFLYRITTLDAVLTVPFTLPVPTSIAKDGLPLRYTATVRGQFSKGALFAADFLSIGNRWTVRGFDGELTLAAERGAYWRNELEAPIGNSGHSVYVGLDAGTVSGPSATTLAGKTLVGTAVGLRGSPFKGLFYDVFLGWALHKPEGFTTRAQAAGFSLTYQY
nr:ShlB/FhaC/HecB family hemolysin secretion/activation protein [Ralstonia sp. ASV6]